MKATSSLLPRLSPAGGIPLHRQVEERLRRLAARPEFQQGGLFPDEVTIANQLGVSRGTVRAALGRLVAGGLLTRKAGVGTRVKRKAIESGIGAWRSFSREMAGKGITVETYLSEFHVQAAPPDVARALQVDPGSPVGRLDRVRGWAGRPVLQSRSWFHPRLRLTGHEDFSQPLYEVIAARTGAVADHASEEFAAVPAPVALAKRLRVKPGVPVLLRRRAVYDAGGRAIEFGEVHYVSSRFSLTLDLRQEER